ncbi:Vancomycin resistance protein YoaR, contains peptidoglycan-binding and VanW domains [Fontibacillus panacisegetis]|uniref:Vancomycin resistance protein YoaR, contains peptidoglycan-binding and VanW domains n=1 Tax=Fontibacillus panacisegetis TaxID=670482 RepID=A0A1G7T112_9BACL|nr:VanW family protein [Fontibacillus panacisegetis]SDG29007.1 Vancomycin resistance protein YoaR, contains peptidoglycan-binding and VanW domains [Fontibacillus panacisegetis]
MRKLHLSFIIISLIFLTVVVLFGGIQLYTSKNTVPGGTVVGNLDLGGYSQAHAVQMLDKELSALSNGRVVFTLQENKETTFSYTWNELGVSWDAPEFRAALLALSSGNLWDRAVARKNFPENWSLQVALDQNKLIKIFSPAWETEHFGDPVNAVRSLGQDDSIRYLPGYPAQRIQWAAFIALIREAIPNQIAAPDEPVSKSKIIIPVILQQPSITIESLKREGIHRKISQFTTSLLASSEGRVHNVDAAARSIDGLILPPDGIFDYASIVEAAEHDYGFREAPVIVNGKLVPGVGGGICQVSSTLYNAAIRAGLEIVERRNHSLPVSYVPRGQDATFAKGYINFQFKNTTDHHLLISARVQNGQLTIKLFGNTPENIYYDIESITKEVLPASNKYVVSSAVPSGSQEIILEGKPGYVVETYRIKKVNGKSLKRTRLSRDTYPAQPAVIAVHDLSENEGETNSGSRTNSRKPPQIIVEDGVDAPTFRAIYERELGD